MAKQNYLKLAVVIVLSMAAASSAYAAAATVGSSIGGSSFTKSNKVDCYYEGATNGSAYGIACAHAQGDKVIAAVSGDAALYFRTATPGGATSTAASISTSTVVTATATWTSM